MQAGRNLAVLDAQGRLDQPGDPGSGFAMAEVCFDRAHPAGLVAWATLAQDGAQGPQFDRIPLAGARAVGFDVLGGGRVQAGAGKGLAHAGDLGLEVGGGHAIAAAVGIDGRAMDQGHDRIAAAAGLREGFQQHHPRPFRAHVAIGAGVKTLATSIGRQQPGLAEAHLDARMDEGLHATGQGRRGFAAPEAFTGQMHGHQRRGAGRVNGEAGALQIQEIGDPVGGNAARIARQHERLVIGGGVVLAGGPEQGAVIEAGDANEDPHRLAAQAIEGLAAMLEGAPGHLQQQPLLGIHAKGFPRRDAEEGRIKLVDPPNEAATPDVLAEGLERIGVEMLGQVPAAGGNVRNPITPFAKQVPKGLGRANATGKPTTHAHNRDGFGAGDCRREGQ